MATKVLLALTMLVAVNSQVNGQFLGQFNIPPNFQYQPIPTYYNAPAFPTFTMAPPYLGNVIRESNPIGNFGRVDRVGYQFDPFKATLSQSYDKNGFSNPITAEVQAALKTPQGSGVTADVNVKPGIGEGRGTLMGQLNIIDNPSHKLDTFVQHSRPLDKDLKPVGMETNSAGVNYLHKDSGATVSASTSQTNGGPARTNVGATIPVYKNDNVQVSVTGGATAGHEMKPQTNVGVQVSGTF